MILMKFSLELVREALEKVYTHEARDHCDTVLKMGPRSFSKLRTMVNEIL